MINQLTGMAVKYDLHSFLIKLFCSFTLRKTRTYKHWVDSSHTESISDGSHGQTRSQELSFLGFPSSSWISPAIDACIMDLVACEFLLTNSQGLLY